MKAKAALSAVLSIVLATAAAAQTAVVEGRIVYGRGAPLQGALAPPSMAPGPPLAGPSLISVGLTPAPAAVAPAPMAPALAAPAAVAPLAAIAMPAAPSARAARRSPAAHASPLPGGDARALAAGERIAELKAAFDERAPEQAISEQAGAPALRPGPLAAAPSAPDEPPKPAKQPPARSRFGLARPLVFFLLALIIAQIGIEAQTAAIPPLISKIFGDVSLAADVGMVSSLMELAGTVLSPITSKRLGLKKAYLWSSGLRVAAGGLVAGLLAADLLSLGGLFGLFAVDNFLLGVSFTTEKSIHAVMVDQDQAKLERFKASRQLAIETVATLAPIATGALVFSLGFVPALIAFPVGGAISMAIVALTLRLPGKLAGLEGAELPGPAVGSIGAFLRSLIHDASQIARKPALLFSLLAYSFVYAPTSVIYWLLAPAFAVHLAGPGAEQLATAYSGMITGLYSLGAIAGSLFVMRQQRKLHRARATGVLSEDAHERAMRRSMLRWTAATAAGLAFFLLLAAPFAGWGTLTLPALALFAFGVPQIVAKLKLESYFQSRAPKGSVDDSTAVLEGASSVAITLALWFFGKLLLGPHIVSAFWLAAAVAPYAAALLLLCWALARASRR